MAEREEISKLIADVTKMQSTDPAVKDIQNDIAALDKTVTALMNPAENGSGWKMLDQQDKESLVGQYEAILGKIGTYLKRPENEGPQDENREAIRQTMSKMRDYFTEDMATIRAYNPAAESKSPPFVRTRAGAAERIRRMFCAVVARNSVFATPVLMVNMRFSNMLNASRLYSTSGSRWPYERRFTLWRRSSIARR